MNGSNRSMSDNQMRKMHELLEEILEIQKNSTNTEEGINRVQEIINESSRMVENSTCPSEIIVDAKILQVGSNVFNTNVSSLSTNLTNFSEEKYVRELLNYVESSRDSSGAETEEGSEWACLAPFTYHLFRRSEPLTFMLGPVSLKPLAEGESQGLSQKKKPERQQKKVESEKKVLSQVTDPIEPEEEGSDIYEHILKCLVKEYRKNKKEPVSYFHFVLDPTAYWKTIENIFHFSFLVRDGNVKMTISDGLPVVEPVLRKPEDRPSSKAHNAQFCLTLSVSDWRESIERFQIKSACIPPFVRKTIVD